MSHRKPNTHTTSNPAMLLLCMLLLALALSATGCQAVAQTGQQTNPPETTSSQTKTPQETSAQQQTTPKPVEETTQETTMEPEPSPIPQPQALLPHDDLVEAYFGPLPEATQYTPMQHHEARAVYLGAAANIDESIALAQATEVNAVVIDLKEGNGILYDSNLPLALDIGAIKALYELEPVIQKLHDNGLIVIGRIVCFKDPILAHARPDLSIQDQAGQQLLFSLEGNNPFLDPYNQEAWQYNIDVALEAIERGIDEIQFDYVRFPTGGSRSGAKPYFGSEETVPSRVQAINRFLQVAAIVIQHEQGIPLGADIFGIVLGSKLDGNNIGQDWETVGLTGVDNLCPMIYPSHYANSSTGHYTGNGVGSYINGQLFTKPDLEPYGVMHQALLTGQAATQQQGYAANRPYIQAFTAGYLPEGYFLTYGAAQIKAQIDAIYDAGYREWICWNPAALYPRAAFQEQ